MSALAGVAQVSPASGCGRFGLWRGYVVTEEGLLGERRIGQAFCVLRRLWPSLFLL